MKVLICGHFSFSKPSNDGQTIKTHMIFNLLKDKMGEEDIYTIDTHDWKTKGIYIFIKLFFHMIKSSNIIVLPAQNGIKFFIPFLSAFSKVFNKKMFHYIVIGGWLTTFLEEKRGFIRHLKNFTYIYVETISMKENLEELGLDNVIYLPNFKNINIRKKSELIYQKRDVFKMCTFSRVSKEKGIEDAINAIIKINQIYGLGKVELDIYGQIDSDYNDQFMLIVKKLPPNIHYRGVVSPHESTSIISKYDFLLFPTYYKGEGFAGTIIDAYASGTPIIASDWKYNPEIIRQGHDGFLFKSNDVDALVKVISNIIIDNKSYYNMRVNCITRAKEFTPDNIFKILSNNLNKGNN